jgi:dienelactone hydrolase
MRATALTLIVATMITPSLPAAAAPPKPVLYEAGSGTNKISLPDPLVSANGKPVTTAAEWQQQRRPEILELFKSEVYGRNPIGRPGSLKFTVEETVPDVMEGAATRKQVAISYRGPGGEGTIHLMLFTPNHVKPAPCFLLICNRSGTNIDISREIKSGFWPAEEMVRRGYAAAAFLNSEVDPDFDDGFTNGVHGIFDPMGGRAPDAWGTLAAWAWGASRVMDYLETDPAIDAKRVAVVGHSRGGKTALWAGASDDRFAMAVSNESGAGGANLARRRMPKTESVAAITKRFPYWFNANYRNYADNEDALPIDQHMLGALIAPRLLYVASAEGDVWADPQGEFISAREAGRVWRLFNLPGLVGADFPPVNTPLQEGRVGYHIRPGKHDLTLYDWQCYMDFADKYLKAKDVKSP